MRKLKVALIAALSLITTFGAMTAQAASSKKVYLVSSYSVVDSNEYRTSTNKYTITYDAKGRIKSETEIADNSKSCTSYKYNDYGVKSLHFKDLKGGYGENYRLNFTIKKAKKGYTVTMGNKGYGNYKVNYNKKYSIVSDYLKAKVSYNGKGYVTRFKCTSGVYTYTYDANGNIKTSQKGSEKEIYSNTYDNNGNLIKQVIKTYSNGEYKSTCTYTYSYILKKVPAGKLKYVKQQQRNLKNKYPSSVPVVM